MNRQNVTYIQTIKCYSALKKKEILIHPTTGMSLEDILLSERSHLQKCKDYMTPPFLLGIWNIHRDKK